MHYAHTHDDDNDDNNFSFLVWSRFVFCFVFFIGRGMTLLSKWTKKKKVKVKNKIQVKEEDSEVFCCVAEELSPWTCGLDWHQKEPPGYQASSGRKKKKNKSILFTLLVHNYLFFISRLHYNRWEKYSADTGTEAGHWGSQGQMTAQPLLQRDSLLTA